jgi:hypothetical protein
MLIYRSDPRFWRLRIIELIQIRECHLRGEAHDQGWRELAIEAGFEEMEGEIEPATNPRDKATAMKLLEKLRRKCTTFKR